MARLASQPEQLHRAAAVRGPYVQVFPFNQWAKDRKFSIRAYLTY